MNRTLELEKQGPRRREGRRLDRLALTALAGLAAVCVLYWSDLYGLSLAAGTVAEVFVSPGRLAGATLWVAGWIWGLV
jgi:hypothetical protein